MTEAEGGGAVLDEVLDDSSNEICLTPFKNLTWTKFKTFCSEQGIEFLSQTLSDHKFALSNTFMTEKSNLWGEGSYFPQNKMSRGDSFKKKKAKAARGREDLGKLEPLCPLSENINRGRQIGLPHGPAIPRLGVTPK